MTTFAEKLEALRLQCEEVCGGAMVGPTTAYFETTEDSEGNTMRFMYLSQIGRHKKDEGYDAGWKTQDPPPLTVKADLPTDADMDACVREFFEGFCAIAAEKRNPGEGIVWRLLPIIRHQDDGYIGIRARYAFVPQCKIVFPGPKGGVQDVVPFSGGR